MTAPVNPLAFAAALLEERGALLEGPDPGQAGGGDPRLFALLPEALAGRLSLPESCHLGLRSEVSEVVSCGMGTPLLDGLVELGRERAPQVCMELDLEAPRTSQVRRLAERFVIRNGVSEVTEVGRGVATYLWAAFVWVAQADDRYEGQLHRALCVADGSRPESTWSARVSPGGLLLPSLSRRSQETEAEAAPLEVEPLARWLGARAERGVREALAGIVATTHRRHARDHARIAEYYAALAEETRAHRGRASEEARRAKLEHLRADRDAKLAELRARYTLRVRIAPVGLLRIETPIATARLRVRRRKLDRELQLRMPAGASALDAIACDACAGATSRPLLCDDRLHVICERCLPNAAGRPRCPAC